MVIRAHFRPCRILFIASASIAILPSFVPLRAAEIAFV